MKKTTSHTKTSIFKRGEGTKPTRPKRLLVSIISLVIFSFVHTPVIVHAQDETNYAVQANIIYHFTKYIDWPPDKKTGDFIIGVTGNSSLFEELKKHISGKMVGNQKIVIKTLSSSAASFACHILVIGDDESGDITKIVSRTTGASTLLVSESGGLAQKGSFINFVLESGHLKLEINKTNIGRRNLDIASELLQPGKVVK